MTDKDDSAAASEGWPFDGVDPSLARRLQAHIEEARTTSVDDRTDAARRVGEVFRRAIDLLTATPAPAEVLADVGQLMETVVSRLQGYGANRRYEGLAEASGLGHDRAHFDWSPLLGASNPLAPPLILDVEDDVVVGRGRFGAAYEGPPGCVHGGFVAAAFDEVLGLTQSLSGQVGMTGTLNVRYRRPTPLHTDLRWEGRLDSVSGRKVFTSAVVKAKGEITAEATGLFVTVSPERFASLASLRERHAHEQGQ
jgi:acyl-coenzyme A thioesterase PaaI-like protein